MNNPSFRAYSDFREELSEQKTTTVEETQYFLQKIKDHTYLNAFLETYDEEALEQARIIDSELKEGKERKLSGLILGIKDNLCYNGHKAEAGSKILDNFDSLFSSTAIQRLLDEGAIIIGRLNCDEFGMGSSNENSPHGPVKNFFDTERVPGGSSGGSAVAVQAGLCHASLGTDTGGSVRQPASFCGVYGFKPTYGRVSRYGLIAYASSFDQIAPFTVNLSDAASILEVMAGKDPNDATSSSVDVPSYSAALNEIKPPHSVAILGNSLTMEGLRSEIAGKIQEITGYIHDQGIQLNESEFSYFDYVVPTYQILSNAEASSNLSRYAGMLYGHQSESAEDVETTITNSRTEGFGNEVKRRIMLGTFVLNTGYYEAYYEKAQKLRRLIRDQFLSILEENDVIILPTTPTGAFQFGKNAEDPVAMYLEDIYTVPASLAGLPAVSIPCGTDRNGMPFGLQLIGKDFGEEALFRHAGYISQLINQYQRTAKS